MAKSYTNRRYVRKIRASPFKSLRVSMLQNLALGIIRGFGMALGFSGLAVILLFIGQFLPLTSIPIIGDIVNAVINQSNGG